MNNSPVTGPASEDGRGTAEQIAAIRAAIEAKTHYHSGNGHIVLADASIEPLVRAVAAALSASREGDGGRTMADFNTAWKIANGLSGASKYGWAQFNKDWLVKEIVCALSRSPDGWRAIDSAPKDGRHIQVVNINDPNTIPATVHWWAESEVWALSVNRFAVDCEYVWGPPTHWRDLSEPPVNQE